MKIFIKVKLPFQPNRKSELKKVTMELEPSPMSDRRNESFENIQININDEKERQHSTQSLPKEEKKRTLSEKLKVRLLFLIT